MTDPSYLGLAARPKIVMSEDRKVQNNECFINTTIKHTLLNIYGCTSRAVACPSLSGYPDAAPSQVISAELGTLEQRISAEPVGGFTSKFSKTIPHAPSAGQSMFATTDPSAPELCEAKERERKKCQMSERGGNQ